MNKKIKNSHIKIIKEAIINKNLAIFIGSGISHCTAPEKYPMWGKICTELKTELDTKETDFLKLAQLYQLEFGKIKTKKKIRSFFPDVDIPCEIQRKILDIEPHYILTTNWDKLFDNEINSNADIYDIVVDDRSLIESTNDCKYIKMHGDFEHNNFVFTEDDYLNYSNTFPILENFIKTILSTHIVLFLGYSFSDIDLKQIENWIQNNTDVTPQMYLTKFSLDINETEKKYLEKFRITVLPIEIEDDSDDAKKDGINYFLDVLLGIQNNEINENPESYILDKLKNLSQFPVILRRQIQEHLSNCGFEYDQYSRAILIFYKNVLTSDFDKSKRKLYELFVKNLPNEDSKISKTLNTIISILQQADIHGIMRNEKDDFENTQYFSFDGTEDIYNTNNYTLKNPILDFNLELEIKENPTPEDLLRNIVKLSLLGSYKDAFVKNKEVLQICKKNKDYKNMFIAMFNYNFLLNKLKTSLDRDKFVNYKSANLEIEFYKLPKRTQLNIKDILDFVNFNYIYREIVSINQSLNKVVEAANIVKNGGFSYSNDSYKYPTNHKNLIDYVLENNVLIESYVEYTEICKNYLRIALQRQSIKEQFVFNKYELFTAIKYFSNKDLQQLFNDNLESNKPKIIVLSDDILEWLIDIVFVNCIKYFDETNRIDSSFERYITNIIFICSMTKIPERTMTSFLDNLGKFIASSRNTLSTFSSINTFWGIQYNIVNNKKIPDSSIIEILNKIIDKFLEGRCNAYEYTVLAENRIYNFFGYLNNIGVIYSDTQRVQNLIITIKKLESKERIDFCMNLLFQLYRISDESVKVLIKEYVSDKEFSNPKKDDNNFINLFMFNLSLQILEITNVPDKLIKQFEELIQNYPKHTFNSIFYQIQKQLDFLLKNDNRYKNLKDSIDEIIKNKEKDFLIPSQL